MFIELFLRVARLYLGELGVHIFVGGGEVELGGALLQDLVIDHLMKNVQPRYVGLLRRGCCGLSPTLAL